MSTICSQTHPIPWGTQNLGQPKKHFFDTLFQFWPWKGPKCDQNQLWHVNVMGKLQLAKKIGEFWAPGAEIWLFKKKKYGPFHWSWSSTYGGIGWMQIGGNVGNLWENPNIWQLPRANLHLSRLAKAACRSSPEKTQWDMFWKTKYMSSVLRHSLWVIASLTFPIRVRRRKIFVEIQMEIFSVDLGDLLFLIKAGRDIDFLWDAWSSWPIQTKETNTFGHLDKYILSKW